MIGINGDGVLDKHRVQLQTVHKDLCGAGSRRGSEREEGEMERGGEVREGGKEDKKRGREVRKIGREGGREDRKRGREGGGGEGR